MLLDKLTIGSSLESAVYALLNDTYFLPTLKFGPMFYEEVEHKFLLTESKELTWSRINLMLALSGKLLNYQNIQSIRVSENLLKVSADQGVFKYHFGICNIFDPTNIQLDNEVSEEAPTKFIVYDDFEISVLGGKHKYLEPKLSNEGLAGEIYYYTSDRVDGASYVTDCVAQSLLTREQLHDVDYSDSMVRFAVSRHLTSIGIYGSFMDTYKSGKPKYRKPKIVHRKRVVIEQEMNKYVDSESIKFLHLSTEEIINAASNKRP